MIVHLKGRLVSASPLACVVDCGGLGYEILIPLTTAEKLPPAGAEVFLHTHTVYREDSQSLYGFADAADRDFFRLLIEKVSGVGPKVALGILSKLALPVLTQAIHDGNAGLLAQTPGIGKKTAERLIVELRDKIGPALPGGRPALAASASSPGAASAIASPEHDAVLALVALGYKLPDADQAVRTAARALGPNESLTVEALLRKVFNR
ncbi:MAG: Holliday junction branch migration protein RuvA [Puniceicoccaceae bacterium]|nr:MAG: Holliday junction branch migration protein RuvA [Puniceicoccaceae bacterium]